MKKLNYYQQKNNFRQDRIYLGRMYFTGNDGYQFFFVFAPMLNSLTLDNTDNNKKVTNSILTRVSPENLTTLMSNLAHARVSLKFSTSVLMQKNKH